MAFSVRRQTSRAAAASSSDVTLSPRRSSVTVIPAEFNSRHAASAWSRSWPATKRVAKRWASEEVSIHLRKSLRRDRKMKKLRTIYRLTSFTPSLAYARLCRSRDREGAFFVLYQTVFDEAVY